MRRSRVVRRANFSQFESTKIDRFRVVAVSRSTETSANTSSKKLSRSRRDSRSWDTTIVVDSRSVIFRSARAFYSPGHSFMGTSRVLY